MTEHHQNPQRSWRDESTGLDFLISNSFEKMGNHNISLKQFRTQMESHLRVGQFLVGKKKLTPHAFHNYEELYKQVLDFYKTEEYLP